MLTSNSIWGQNDSLLLSRELKNGDTLFFSFQVSGSDFIMEEIQLVKSNDEIELSFYKQSYGKNWEHPDVWRTSANFKSLTLRKLTVEEFGEFILFENTVRRFNQRNIKSSSSCSYSYKLNEHEFSVIDHGFDIKGYDKMKTKLKINML